MKKWPNRGIPWGRVYKRREIVVRDLENIKNQTVLVVGDMMVDKYILGTVSRISPEAPVPVLHQREVRRKLGGAGNVVVNVVNLGARIRAVGRVGDDAEGAFFLQNLSDLHVDTRYIFMEGSTITKTRVSASNQQFIRIDEEAVTIPSKGVVERIKAELDTILSGVTVVVLSDYAKGFLTEELTQSIISAAKERGIIVLVDPKGKHVDKYRGATAVTPNNKEFMDMTGLTELPGEAEIEAAGLRLCTQADLDYVIFTRSEKGISVIDRVRGEKSDYPALKKEVVDVTGAGDTVVATIALTLGAGFPMNECITIANHAASIVISRFGAAQATVEELKEALGIPVQTGYDRQEVLEQIAKQKRQGKKVVFTNGCFDLVHAGHISSFRQARSFGDILVVGVNSDESIRRLKGETRPIVSLPHRIALLTALECVDYVIPFEEDTPQSLIEQVQPDVLVKGKDWEGKRIAGDEFVRSYGGSVRFVELEQGLSTTELIERIKKTIK